MQHAHSAATVHSQLSTVNCLTDQLSTVSCQFSFDMLCRQGRMHPEVALFANHTFYEGRLLPVGLPHQQEDSSAITRLAFYPSEPEPAGASAKMNHSEARIAARLALTIYQKEGAENFNTTRTLGIITPLSQSDSTYQTRNSPAEHPCTQ